MGLNFLLASASCKRAHTLSLDSYCRPSAGKSSRPAGLSTLVYAYVRSRLRAHLPYAYSSSTHRIPDERTPIQATPLSATSAELGSGLGLGLGLGSLAQFSSHALPSSCNPPFTQYPYPPRSLMCSGQPGQHMPRLVVSQITCPPLSSSPHAHSFVLGTAVINNNKKGSRLTIVPIFSGQLLNCEATSLFVINQVKLTQTNKFDVLPTAP